MKIYFGEGTTKSLACQMFAILQGLLSNRASLDLGLFFITLKIMRICLLVVGLIWSLESIYSSDFTGLKRFDSFSSRGIAWGDFNNDEKLDVAVSSIEEGRVYQNMGGVDEFTPFFSFARDTSYGIGFADLNNSGYLDLLVISRDILWIYINEGGRFIDSLFYIISNARSLAFGDYNNDSYIDIAVACIGQNKLLKSTGKFFFDLKDMFGADSSYSISWADYNNDGYSDIAVANLDKGVRCYKNEGGYFRESEVSSRPKSHSVSWGDYDNDGWLDLAVGYLGDINRLYRSDSGDTFYEKSQAFGISQDSTISIAWADYNNDGYLDLVASNLGQPNKGYENHEGRRFDSPEELFDVADSSYGIAWADCDGDGDLDLAVANDGQNMLYKNTRSGTKRIKLRLRGRGKPYSNSYGIGAKVFFKIYNNSLVGYREMRAGGGFCSQDALEIIFGTLSFGDVYDIVIIWPSGIVDTLKGVKSGETRDVLEDSRPPQNPTKVWSTSHNEDEWSNNLVIEMAWHSGKDTLGSGVMGYSFLFDKDPFTSPDETIDIYQPNTTVKSDSVSEGYWYFHLKTVDSVENWTVDPVHSGPYKIDTTSPSTPSLIAPPNGLYTNQSVIEFSWHSGIDTLSGIEKYAISIALDSSFINPETHHPNDTIVRLGPLDDTLLFWRVKAIDSAGNEGEWSESYSLVIDTTPPRVEYTFPKDDQQGISPTANILVEFTENETMDSSSINPSSFKVENTATGIPITPDSIKFDGTYWIFYPKGLLPEETWIRCDLTKDIKDLAGNHLIPHRWSFRTGKAKDSIPPIISEAKAIPKRVMEEDTLLIIEATVEDTGKAVSDILRAEYFIDSIVEGESHRMDPKDGHFDSSKEEVVDTLLTKNLAYGTRKFFIRAQDGSGNWSSYDTLVVKVARDTTLILEIEREPEKIPAGDTLDITIKARDKKGELRILKDIYLYAKMGDKIEDIPPTTRDSIIFKAKYVPSGVYIGEAWLICEVMDVMNTYAEDTVSFFIEPAHDSFPKKGVYAWPNPATTDKVHFHYTLRADADTVRLSIYTLDGKLLHREDKENVSVDKTEDFIVNLNKFSNGVYFFKIDAKFRNKTKKVIKKFAVVR